jgi:hypothetical protein
MTTFSLFITDERYAIPTVALIEAAGRAAAAMAAKTRREESPHYEAIELYEDDRVFYRSPRRHLAR